MSRLRYFPHLVVYLGMLNFVLFFLSMILLGGDALTGKIEAGHYYLGNHGAYTEVAYPVYILNWLWGVLTVVSFPLIIVFMILSWGADYGDQNEYTDHVANLGRVYGFVEGLFSRLFDSWRKPDLECFARLTTTECIQEILSFSSWRARHALKKNNLNLIWGGQHFEMSRSSFWNWRGIPLVLHGRLYSTPHGTYLKAWYRWSTQSLLLLSIFAMFGLQFLLLVFEWLMVRVLGANQAATVEFFRPLWPIWSRVSLVIGALLLVAFSGWWGRHRRRELALIVKENLTPDSLAHLPLPARDIHH